jgi:cytosine/adenosine deaminase-related metal-dependent hydrolase
MNDVFSQIVHCAKASDVRTVMVNGEILMRDRRLTGHDETKLLSDARQANRDLMERVSALSF